MGSELIFLSATHSFSLGKIRREYYYFINRLLFDELALKMNGDTKDTGSEEYLIKAINTLYLIGSLPMRLMAKINGQCEIGLYIQPENKSFVIDVINQGIEEGLFYQEKFHGLICFLEKEEGAILIKDTIGNPLHWHGIGLDDEDDEEDDDRTEFERLYEAVQKHKWLEIDKGSLTYREGYLKGGKTFITGFNTYRQDRKAEKEE